MHFSPLVLLGIMAVPAAEAAAQDGPGTVKASPTQASSPSQAVLSPTALTPPAGSLSFSSYDLAGLGVTYVPIDRLQLKAIGVIGPVVQADNLVPFRHIEAKLRLLDWGRLHLSLVGFSTRMYQRYVTTRLEGGGLVATLCATPDCRWAFSLGAMVGSLRTDGSTDDGGGLRSTALVYSASVVGTLSRHWSLLLEAVGTGEIGCNLHCEDQPLGGLFLSVGPRFSWRALTVDAALVLAMEPGSSVVEPLPWLAVSYRAF